MILNGQGVLTGVPTGCGLHGYSLVSILFNRSMQCSNIYILVGLYIYIYIYIYIYFFLMILNGKGSALVVVYKGTLLFPF